MTSVSELERQFQHALYLENTEEGSFAWWHKHGFKMQVAEELDAMVGLITTSGAAFCAVTHLIGNEDHDEKWRVEYGVHYGPRESDFGFRSFDTEMLATAFRITSNPSPAYAYSYIASKVDASYGYQGHFVRLRNYLNVPMPGTGNDGDPNISIFLSDEIQEAVANLIQRCTGRVP